MDEKVSPTLERHDGVSRFTFPDHTRLEVHHPQKDQFGRLWARVIAWADEQTLLNDARIDLLDQRARVDFYAMAGGREGGIDWHARLVLALHQVERMLEVSVQMPSPDVEWEPATPFHAFDLPPFPTDALPGWQRDFVEAETLATQTPPDLAGMLSLSVVAAACAKKVVVRVKRDYVEPVNLFTATALPPGNRKTKVFADTTAPLEAWEAEQTAQMRDEIAEVQARYKITEQAFQKAQADAARANPAEREKRIQEAVQLGRELAAMSVPVPPRLIADDTSPERLATLLRDHGERMTVMAPEGDVFDLMAGRYSGNGTPNFGVYLRGHAGDTIRVDRVGRPPEFVMQPALTMGLAVQPEVLRSLVNTPGFRGRGLLGRFLYALPKSLLGRRDTNPPSMPPAVRAAYRAHVLALLQLPFGSDVEGNPAPHVLELSPGARASLQAFEAWLEPQLAEFGELGHMTDWAGKLLGATARIAGLLHMAEQANHDAPWEVPISAQVVERAIRIAQYLIPHARAAYAEMGSDPVVEDARYVLGWLMRHGIETITKRELFEGTKGRFKRVNALEPVLTLLVEHHVLREQPLPGRSGLGRKPSPTYDVNPLVHSHHAQYSDNSSEPGNSANRTNSANQGETDQTEPVHESEIPEEVFLCNPPKSSRP